MYVRCKDALQETNETLEQMSAAVHREMNWASPESVRQLKSEGYAVVYMMTLLVQVTMCQR